MYKPESSPQFAFVWRAEELDRTFVDACQSAGARAIVDLAEVSVPDFAEIIAATGALEAKITADQFASTLLDGQLADSGLQTLWVHFHPAVDQVETTQFFSRAEQAAEGLEVIPVTGDPGLIGRLATRENGPKTMAVKGCEAAGWVGPDSLSVLYATAEGLAAKNPGSPGLAVWGGVATPEAAAAFLATGAETVVFESLHWLTERGGPDQETADRLRKMRLDHTRLVGPCRGVAYRAHDKGNNRAVKELAGLAAESGAKALAQYTADHAVHPLSSGLAPDRLIPMGPEASFAAGFVERFGRRTEAAIAGFIKETARCAARIDQAAKRYTGETAGDLGCRYAIIQGGMSWISDRPAFARAVAEAGALPTIALGLMDGDTLQKELGGLGREMGHRPYAVNVITLEENPFLDQQMDFIGETRPPYTVIAAGEPGRAAPLLEQGLGVIYLAPDLGLLRLALEAGIKWVVLEGFEAGGHVGAHTTLTLAQAALEMRRAEPELFAGARLVLAGGIYNRPTALRAAMLGADAVQMGTAYLGTREIVETGALQPLYQRMILESAPGGTVVTGRPVGLAVRALASDQTRAISELERSWAAGGVDEGELRRRLEEMAGASLLKAARAQDRPDGDPLDEAACRREGQFMAGAAAGAIGEVCGLEELHHEVAEGAFQSRPVIAPRPAARQGRAAVGPVGAPAARERLAVTGMAISNALGNDPEEVWRGCMSLANGVREVPAERWDHSRYFDPAPLTPEKTYCRVGAFGSLEISRKELGVPPQDWRTMTGSTRLTLWLAKHALEDSGLLDSGVEPARVGVLISQNSGEAAGTLRELIVRTSAGDIVEDLRTVLSLSPEQAEAAATAIGAGKLSVDDTTLLGRLNCAAAGFICNKYGFRGPSFSVSAACATSLVALYNAVHLVRSGVLDAALVGGGEEPLNPAHFLEFGALGALSGLSGNGIGPERASRPFDRTRDGMVLGEGGGMLVIERESVAKARGAAIHAYITGMGASNNDKGMVESLAETQELAMAASFADAGYGPDTVGLVECHATSTAQGDVQEVAALKAFYPQGRPTVLASMKSQIGHTLGASGVNSLIRTICALRAQKLPATLNYREPDPEMGLEDWGFKVLERPEDWPTANGTPRRAQVNAFGFGGANYVVQVEQSNRAAGLAVDVTQLTGVADDQRPTGPSVEGVHLFKAALGGRDYRLGVTATDGAEARSMLEGLEAPGGEPEARLLRAWSRDGVFAAPDGEEPPPLAFVFAGQGSQYQGMSRELYETFEPIRRVMDEIAEVAEFDILDLLFNSREEDLQKTRWQQPALFTMEYAMVRYLMGLGARPAAMAGHSLGELVALCVAGVFSPADGFRLVNQRALCMDKAAGLALDPGAMVAVDAPMDYLNEKVDGSERLYFTNYNSPRQLVIGGDSEAVEALRAEFEEDGHWNVRLKVSMAFHSPIMKVIREEMAEFIEGLHFHAPIIPVISNTTRLPFPDDPAEIKRIVMAHLEAPVHWMQNVETLASDFGVGLFVEVGPKESISNLVADTIKGARTMHTCHPDGEAEAYGRAVAGMWSLGCLELAKPARVTIKPGPTKEERARAVAQREINEFVKKNLDGALADQLLGALRREVDGEMGGQDLRELIAAGLSLNPPIKQAQPAAEGSDAAGNGDDVLEQVITLLMEATGYERDEIEPDMEIRGDLAIRSSRLPVIMNAAEQTFGIIIRLEDFIEVRTVRDLADTVAAVAARDGAAAPQGGGAAAPDRPEAEAARPRPKAEAPSEPVDRLVFGRALVDPGQVAVQPPAPGSEAALVCAPGSDLADTVSSWLTAELGAEVVRLELSSAVDGFQGAAKQLAGLGNLAGLVWLLEPEMLIDASAETVTELLTDWFGLIKKLLSSESRAFAVSLAGAGLADIQYGAALAQGVAGVHLAANQEYPSLLWRSLELEPGGDLNAALGLAFSPQVPELQLMAGAEGVFTPQMRSAPLSLPAEPVLELGPKDVVVLSGGARGITAHLARALAVTGCTLALLGRAPMDPDQDYSRQLRTLRVAGDMGQAGPELEAAAALAELRSMGCRASYYQCDVSDQDQVTRALERAAAELGPVTGLVHGAGVLADSYMQLMSEADFARVVAVKLQGLDNLARAAGGSLRFVAALSSVAAAMGNPGQANYCAANRAMAGMVRYLAARQGIVGRVLWLPPIEGAGMADDPELRELMKIRGMDKAFVKVSEAARWFAEELILGPTEDDWVMPARNLPATTVLRFKADEVKAAFGLRLESGLVPLIDTIERLDLAEGEMTTGRVFSHDRDPWLADHKPFKFLRHPLVSGIMAVENFLETSSLLMPHLRPMGAERISYLDILEVPEGVRRGTRTTCRLKEEARGRAVCEVSLASRDIAPGGRELDRHTVNYQGRVILAGVLEPLPDWPDFAVSPKDLDTRPMEHDEVTERYQERTSMQGRYRLVHNIDGTGDGVISGVMRYPDAVDFAQLPEARLVYPAYALEGLMQLVNFYLLMREDDQSPLMIPAGMAAMRFARPGLPGEELRMEARLRSSNEEGYAWDARALDGRGRPVLLAEGIELKWYLG